MSGTSSTSRSSQSVSALKRRISELETEVESLSKSPKPQKMYSVLRQIALWLLAIICAASLVASAVSLWVTRSIMDTDRWVAQSSELLQDPAIQRTVAENVSAKLFASVDVETYLTQVLPDRIDGLAGTLAQSLEANVASRIVTILGSEQFVSFWETANRSAHKGIVYSVTHNGKVTDEIRQTAVIYIEGNELTLNVKTVYQGVKKQLSTQGFSFVDAIPDTNTLGTMTLARVPYMPAVLTSVKLINDAATWLPVIALLSGAGAVLLARHKRRVMMGIAWVVALLMLIAWQTISYAQYAVVAQVEAQFSDAAFAGYSVLTYTLLSIIRTVLIMALLVVAAGFITGSSRPAEYVRRGVRRMLHAHTHPKLQRLVGDNTTLIIGSIALVSIMLIAFPLSRSPIYYYIVVGLAVLLSFIVVSLARKTSDS